MTGEERFEIIAASRKDPLVLLAAEVRKHFKVRELKRNTALVMLRVKDTVAGEVFNLGEVLTSEAEVEINGAPGYSQVLGDDTKKALAGAILDAACRIEHPLRERITKMLNQEKKYYEKERAKEYAKIKSTTVNFEAMA